MSIPRVDNAPDERAPTPALAANWESAYRENVDWVYRFVYGRVGNHLDAEDVTAEVFMRSLPRLRLAAPTAQLRAYLAMAARTVLVEHWRNGYDVELNDYSLTDVPQPQAWPDVRSDENARRASGLLARLPEHYRRVLELRFLQGCSLRETAAALRITIGNAKVLQHRALRRAAELGKQDLA
jgi:RNA polymerase sigma-70 factor (ECF subfamily)